MILHLYSKVIRQALGNVIFNQKIHIIVHKMHIVTLESIQFVIGTADSKTTSKVWISRQAILNGEETIPDFLNGVIKL